MKFLIEGEPLIERRTLIERGNLIERGISFAPEKLKMHLVK